MANEIQDTKLFERIAALLDEAKKHVRTTINLSMVYTNYEIGRMIVEDEQQGNERAAYGKGVLKDLSKRLTARFGKGYSEDNLKLMRRFYTVYSAAPQIGENSFPELENDTDSADDKAVTITKNDLSIHRFLQVSIWKYCQVKKNCKNCWMKNNLYTLWQRTIAKTN